MKTNDLMVGDWVRCPYVNVKVGEIKTDRVECYEPHRIACEIDSVEPILLTKKILEKNGWSLIRGNVYGGVFVEEINDVEYEFDIPFRIAISGSYCHEKIFATTSEDVLIPMLYVHEVQHALRMCGLYDLADIFEI